MKQKLGFLFCNSTELYLIRVSSWKHISILYEVCCCQSGTKPLPGLMIRIFCNANMNHKSRCLGTHITPFYSLCNSSSKFGTYEFAGACCLNELRWYGIKIEQQNESSGYARLDDILYMARRLLYTMLSLFLPSVNIARVQRKQPWRHLQANIPRSMCADARFAAISFAHERGYPEARQRYESNTFAYTNWMKPFIV